VLEGSGGNLQPHRASSPSATLRRTHVVPRVRREQRRCKSTASNGPRRETALL
jgi:hypothetical protein